MLSARKWILVLAVACLAGGLAPAGAGTPDSSHARGANSRDDKTMGFSRMKTSPHFRLFPDGGAIEVIAIDFADTVSRDAVCAHLRHVAVMLDQGDFNLPMIDHDGIPPGVADMERLKGKIRYLFEPLDGGGRVRISTRNARALVAIHEFLRYQITDHKTGDPLEVVDAQR